MEEKLAGDMFGQFGYSGFSYGRNHDDGFTIYLDDAEAQPLVYHHAEAVQRLNHNCKSKRRLRDGRTQIKEVV